MFINEVLFKRGLQLACSQCRFYRSANPGMSRRLKIFKQETPDLSRAKLTEKDFDDSEIDIMDGSLVGEYEREHKKISTRIAFQRIEREYFNKSKLPNFLLWSEKEQIRQLHQSEPEKWTCEALSQSFPATADVIKKMVQAQWKLKDPGAIKKHDNKVNANWKALMQKKIELPSRIAKHLTRFTARERSLSAKESKDLTMIPDQQPSTQSKLTPTKSSQFINIVRKPSKFGSSGKENSNDGLMSDSGKSTPTHPSETYVLGGRVPQRLKIHQYTLSEMKESGGIMKRANEPYDSSPSIASDEISPDVTMNHGNEPPKGVAKSKNIDSFSIPRYASASSVTASNDERLEEIPMRITIPKEKWKKGAVYKVNNCFYADDGEFLYKI